MKTYYLKPIKDSRASFYNKATVEEDDATATLYSYMTKVCTIDKASKTFKLNKDVREELLLSTTTLRHIKEFLYQFEIKNAPKTKGEFLKVLRS